MKKTLGFLTAVAFIFAATAVYAQTTATPAAKPLAPAVEKKVETAPVVKVTTPTAPATVATTTMPAAKDPKAEATEVCKKKGLANEALDACVKSEISKPVVQTTTPATTMATAPKAPAAAPTTTTTSAPAAPKAPTTPIAPAAPKAPATTK